jgi:hypothetical protein
MRTNRKRVPQGEYDLKRHAKVYLPTLNGGYVQAWVKITEGDKSQGTGILDDEPENAGIRQGRRTLHLKLGDQIKYAGGNERVIPKFVKRLPGNQLEVLKKAVANDIQLAMSFNPCRA